MKENSQLQAAVTVLLSTLQANDLQGVLSNFVQEGGVPRTRKVTKRKGRPAKAKAEANGEAPKRRGRPPGSGKKAAASGEAPKRRGRPPGAGKKAATKARKSKVSATLTDAGREAILEAIKEKMNGGSTVARVAVQSHLKKTGKTALAKNLKDYLVDLEASGKIVRNVQQLGLTA
jgi:hypothetical protein